MSLNQVEPGGLRGARPSAVLAGASGAFCSGPTARRAGSASLPARARARPAAVSALWSGVRAQFSFAAPVVGPHTRPAPAEQAAAPSARPLLGACFRPRAR